MEHIINRRKFLKSSSIMALCLWLDPKTVFDFQNDTVTAQESPVITIRRAAATAKIEITKLRGNISVLEGSGGNICVLTGPEGKLLVDAGIDSSKPNLVNALNSLGEGNLRFLINTHWHFDHTDGNEWLHQEGATIVSHRNTLKNLSRTIRVEDWDFTFPPASKGALPTVLFDKSYKLKFNNEDLEIIYYSPAHTDSDASVFFKKSNILHVGDTWWNGYYPFIDYSTGGNIKGMIEAAKLNIARVNDDTIVVPGHGPVGNKQQLIEYHQMLRNVYSNVAKLKKEGRSLKQIIDQKPTAEYDKKWGGFVINGDTFTKLVYKGA